MSHTYRMSRTESRQWADNQPLRSDALHSSRPPYSLFPEYAEQTKADESAGRADPGAHKHVERWSRGEAKRHLLHAMGLSEGQQLTARDVIRARAKWQAMSKSHDIVDASGVVVASYVPPSTTTSADAHHPFHALHSRPRASH